LVMPNTSAARRIRLEKLWLGLALSRRQDPHERISHFSSYSNCNAGRLPSPALRHVELFCQPAHRLGKRYLAAVNIAVSVLF
jgi:hypothetical protein